MVRLAIRSVDGCVRAKFFEAVYREILAYFTGKTQVFELR